MVGYFKDNIAIRQIDLSGMKKKQRVLKAMDYTDAIATLMRSKE